MRVMLATVLVVLLATCGYVQSKPDEGPLCQVCDLVVGVVQGQLKNNATDAEIKQDLENYCSKFPLLPALCKDVVDEYFDKIIAYAVNMTAEQVCQEISLCSELMIRTLPSSRLSPKSGIACTICEAAVTAINVSISSNTTQQEIVDELKKVCNVLPSAISGLCNSLIEQYAPDLFKMFEEDNPQQLCSDIDLCSEEFMAKKRLVMLGKK